MFSRWFILRVMLLFQVAISLLGNSGLHSSLGFHHEQMGTEGCSSSKPASKDTSRSCCRHHSQTSTASDVAKRDGPQAGLDLVDALFEARRTGQLLSGPLRTRRTPATTGTN